MFNKDCIHKINDSFLLIFLIVTLFSSCKENGNSTLTNQYTFDTASSLVVSDDTIFNEVNINNQIWSSKNLNVSRFNNGDSIKQAKTPNDWISALKTGQPAWCYYKNDPTLGYIFGKLYNIHAVLDPRGIAPIGFHVPTNNEIQELFNNMNLGCPNSTCYGSKDLMSKILWKTDEYRNGTVGNGSDKYGFSALPSGMRGANGLFFENIGEKFSFWSSSVEVANHPSYAEIDGWGNGKLWATPYPNPAAYGLSIRCIKDTKISTEEYDDMYLNQDIDSSIK
jgi:uncharacterized protein (TIGR02145 family)